MDKISVIGINGSPHKDGTTAKFLKKFLSVVEKQGAQTELINLIDKDIKPCLGCYSKDPKLCTYPCRQKDDMNKICRKLIKADALVFGTPVYWFNMSGTMKNFIDRMCCLAAGGYLLEGKVGIYFAATKENEGGRLNAALSMASAMNHLGLFLPPYGLLWYPGKEEIVRNGKSVWYDWLKEDSEKIAKNLVPLCRFLRKSKFRW